MIVVVLLAPVIVIVAITLFDLLFRRGFRRQAFRNVGRRKGEAALVVLGALLGTAIITSSFIVGDTLDASIRDLARTQLGPIDEVVLVDDPAAVADVVAAVEADPVPGTDGVLGLLSAPATAATRGAEARAEPDAYVHELDLTAARAFGSDPSITGFDDDVASPGPGEAVIGDDLADELGVAVGDLVDLHLYGTVVSVEVTGIVPRIGVAGFNPGLSAESPVAFVAPGTLAPLAAASEVDGAEPPEGRLLVSNAGGVFDSAGASEVVASELDRRFSAGAGNDVQLVKQDLLEDATASGDEFGSVFTVIGGFSVIAGVLLLVNIFVMLAEERKTELGMLRAVGLKRNHLVRMFGLEGAIYSVLAAVVGAAVGVAIGRGVVLAAFAIFNRGDGALPMRFAAEPATLVTGMIVGFTICLLTVWGTSLRIGRLNVIRAIRDLPDPPRTGRRVRSMVLAGLGAALGGALAASGLGSDEPYRTLAGPALALWCLVPLLSRILPRRVAVTVPCGLALAWGVFAFSLVPKAFEDSDVPIFLVQGLILVGSAVALAVANDDLFHRVSDRLGRSGRGIAVRLGLVNPLANRVRTGLLLGMYSIVVFVLVLLSTMASMFAAQAGSLADDASAGFDVLVESSRTNPPSVAQLESEPGVESATLLVQGVPDFSAGGARADTESWLMSGFDAGLLRHGGPALDERDARFATDEEAWRAVLADPSLAVVPSFFLSDDDSGSDVALDPGDTFVVINPISGARRTLTVAAVTEDTAAWNGVMVSGDAVAGDAGRVAAAAAYVAVAPGAEPEGVAETLEADLIPHGVEARTFAAIVDEQVAEDNGFFQLLEGFLALGLVVGIAGLGVVMVRAVRERRRQIGTLRAIGFQARTVRAAFLVESAFISLQGIAIGVGLGLVVAWSLLSQSDLFGDDPIPFRVPWAALLLITTVAFGASLLAVYAPAAQASRIKPAAALRLAD